MEGMIKVAPETLASTASEFGGQATQLQGLTTQMMELIESLEGVEAIFIGRDRTVTCTSGVEYEWIK